MVKYINIKDENKYNKEIKNFLAPNYVYIPYYNGDEALINANEGIKIGNPIIKRKDSYIYSSVSGKVIGMAKMLVDNKMNKTIVLENDYMEKNSFFKLNKKFDSLSKEELINKLVKYDVSLDLDNEYLIVSGLDVEPFESHIKYLVNKFADDILSATSLLINILKIKKCIFVVDSSDSESSSNLVNHIGTYPDIHLKLMPNHYPIGKKEVLAKEIFNNKNPLVLDVEEIINIYDILRRNKPIIEKYVSFSGNLLNKSKVLKVKIGTSISEVLENEFKVKDGDYSIVINGLISGYSVDSLNTLITRNTRSVFVNKGNKAKCSQCTYCGMCVASCPRGVNRVSGYNIDKCINCGVCSYVCPANIKLGGNK